MRNGNAHRIRGGEFSFSGENLHLGGAAEKKEYPPVFMVRTLLVRRNVLIMGVITLEGALKNKKGGQPAVNKMFVQIIMNAPGQMTHIGSC